ncbi:MAG: SMI1/KNR4 family protein [Gemmatimonadales bacterium]
MSGFYEPAPTSTSPFRHRLFHPQWAIIEHALGRPVPGILRELYGTPETLLRGHFYLDQPGGARRVWLDLFLPLDDEALHPYGKPIPAGAVAFADDEHGDPYFFVPDTTVYGDGPVYLLGLQEGREEIQPVAESLSQFLHWPRHTAHGSGGGSQSI